MSRAHISVAAVLALAALCAAIPVYVMLPLTAVTDGGVSNPSQLLKDLRVLQSMGVKGVMIDVWWGLSEPSAKSYNFTAYKHIATMCRSVGLKLQVVMSFHRCGGNVGDECNIPLPSFVTSVGQSNNDIYYKDYNGKPDEEYINLGADHEALFGGRTPLQMYKDFMSAFASELGSEIGSTIDGISVGLGPASELRYPGYQQNKGWSYCGVGEFQVNDKYLLAELKQAASAAGHPEWGGAEPNNAGSWNSRPSDTGFFNSGGFDNYASDYGKFFLSWYQSRLLKHGEDVLSIAKDVFGSKVPLAAKVSGIHWWYDDGSHAAELTTGYYNANGNNAYYDIANTLRKYVKVFDFTCLEMRDSSNNCGSKPATLVQQAMSAAKSAGMDFDGENALELCSGTCDQNGLDQIYNQATSNGHISHFTYLRLTRSLVDNTNNVNIFTNFVRKMANA